MIHLPMEVLEMILGHLEGDLLRKYKLSLTLVLRGCSSR